MKIPAPEGVEGRRGGSFLAVCRVVIGLDRQESERVAVAIVGRATRLRDAHSASMPEWAFLYRRRCR